MDTQSQVSEDSPLHNLLHAFAQFNQLSERLTDSVEQINQSVEQIKPKSAVKSVVSESPLFDAIPGGVVLLDPQGRVMQANASACILVTAVQSLKNGKDAI